MRETRKRKKTAIIIALAIAAVVSVALLAGWTLARPGGETPKEETPGRAAQVDPDVLNVLLIGSDDRHETYKDDSMADCILVCSVNTREKKIGLVSLYRNIATTVKSGPEKNTVCRLNHIFTLGGESMLADTINSDYGLDVNDYIRVNMPAVVKVIDSLGGIDVSVTAEEAEYMNNYNPEIGFKDNEYVVTEPVHEGMNHMDGKTAVVYARGRNMDGGDLKRTQRLREVFGQTLRKAKEAGPRTALKIAEEVLPEIRTSMDSAGILSLAGAVLPDIGSYELEQLQVPENGDYSEVDNQDGINVYEIDKEKYRSAVKEFIYGRSRAGAQDAEQEAAD